MSAPPISEKIVSIDKLIELVKSGYTVKTGVDIFNNSGALMVEKDVLITTEYVLQHIKKLGVKQLPISQGNGGGIWKENGQDLCLSSENTSTQDVEKAKVPDPIAPKITKKLSEIERKIEEIGALKKIGAVKYKKAKESIKTVISDLQNSGGEMDFGLIQETVEDLFVFVSENENSYSALTKEIFSYDDYLCDHSINVCTIGTAIAKKFNEQFSAVVNASLNNAPLNDLQGKKAETTSSYTCYFPDDLYNISIGFFMHDLGKVLIDKKILNKNGKLTEEEFAEVKKHSTERGIELLEKNNLLNPFIRNISQYHHASIFNEERGCYPENKLPREIPPYVKICKLADIYDAMTSRRCYKEAISPVTVVSDIFHKYAQKDRVLQYILHSFVNSIGIYPPGSILTLTNGQFVYILDSSGPTILPLTDCTGEQLFHKPEPVILGESGNGNGQKGLMVDRRKPPLSPVEAYNFLPPYLRKMLSLELE